MTPFEQFWANYPRRQRSPSIRGKKVCRDMFDEIVSGGLATSGELVLAASLYRVSDNVTGNNEAGEKFIMNPETFLRPVKERWWDYLECDELHYRVAMDTRKENRTEDMWRLILKRLKMGPGANLRPWKILELILGPAPLQEGCCVPVCILEEFDIYEQTHVR